LFALTASIARAARTQGPEREPSQLGAAQIAPSARARIERILEDMWSNDDAEKSELARALLAGEHVWLEQGTMGLPYTVEQLRPEAMDAYLKEREARRPARESEPRRIAPTGTHG
jgi:hypothetical protein